MWEMDVALEFYIVISPEFKHSFLEEGGKLVLLRKLVKNS